MEGRIAKLETDVDYIKRDISDIKTDTREIRRTQEVDFRLIFSTIIAVALGLAAIMAKGFGWLK